MSPLIVADATLLRQITALIIAKRFEIQNDRMARRRERLMAFEHKALKGNWSQFRKNLEALNTALSKGNDTMPGVTTNVAGILGQVQGIVDDVEFMGKMLGNGSGDGSDEPEKPKEPVKFEIKPGTTPEQNMQMIEATRQPQEADAKTSEEFHHGQ